MVGTGHEVAQGYNDLHIKKVKETSELVDSLCRDVTDTHIA